MATAMPLVVARSVVSRPEKFPEAEAVVCLLYRKGFPFLLRMSGPIPNVPGLRVPRRAVPASGYSPLLNKPARRKAAISRLELPANARAEHESPADSTV